MKSISIKEIAKLANVSTATVSRVINNTGNVNEDKRKLVMDAIEQTNYSPNKIAQSLFSNSSKIIGYIVPNITNPYFSELGRFLEMRAFEKGYHIILCNSNNDYNKEVDYIKNLNAMNADGVILITDNPKADYKTNLKTVVIDRKIETTEDYFSIRANHYKGSYLATKHLFESGCKKLVYLGPTESISSAVERFKGYTDFCEEHSITPNFIKCDFVFDDAVFKTQLLLNKFKNVDGIVCSNDVIAMACYKILFANGISVPNDIKIIGYDNILDSYMVTPSITTIAQPIKQLAEKAVDVMIDLINDKKPLEDELIFGVELIKRQTT